MKRIAALGLVLILTACGGGLEGSYELVKGMEGPLLTFKPNGKAIYMGAVEMDYEMDGKDVKLHTEKGVLILKAGEDGTLLFPVLGKMRRMPSS